MNADSKTSDNEPVILPGGGLRCGSHVIEPWPSLQVTPSRGFHRGDDLLRADGGPDREAFTRLIPPEILQRVRSFPEGHWRLLEFCAGNPACGLELLVHNPALAVLVVEHCNCPAATLRRRDLAKLVVRPWRGLLADLGMPTRPRTLRILRKLPVAHCTPAIAGRLRRVLRTGGHPWVHVLPHLPMITRDTVGLMSLEPEFVTPNLIRASLDSGVEVETVTWLLASLRGLRLELGHTGPWPYRNLTLDQLKLLEGKLTVQTLPDYFSVFPPPPFAGKPEWILPLQDFATLAAEGSEQANCAVMYLSAVLAGEAFVYRLLRPERATFVLQRRKLNSPWTLADLRCHGNAAPSATTRAFVEAWLRQDS